MSSGSNGILEKIYNLQVSQGVALGVIEGKLHGVERQVTGLDANLALYITHSQEAAKKISIHEDSLIRHERRISDLCRKLDVAEDTGIHIIEAAKTRWDTLKIVGAILLSIITMMAATGGIYKSCKEIKQNGIEAGH